MLFLCNRQLLSTAEGQAALSALDPTLQGYLSGYKGKVVTPARASRKDAADPRWSLDNEALWDVSGQRYEIWV